MSRRRARYKKMGPEESSLPRQASLENQDLAKVVVREQLVNAYVDGNMSPELEATVRDTLLTEEIVSAVDEGHSCVMRGVER